MQSRISWLKMASLTVAAAALAACSGANDSAPMVDSNGKHPANWVKAHGAIANASSAQCTQCHGEDLTGGITRVGCFSTPQTAQFGFVCHATNPVAAAGCDSCHSTPPAGAAAPNRSGLHTLHLQLLGTNCASCHTGAGFGTENHAKATATGGIAGATVNFPASLKAKTAPSFGYDAANGTCSGVICHGGKNTPKWYGGSIDLATDCVSCHEQGTAAQTPQYNSYFSGTYNGANLHEIHLHLLVPNTSTPIVCTDCHNTASLTSHFTSLATPAFGAEPSTTIGGGSTKITSYTAYTAVVPSGSCTSTCHAANGNNPRNWINN